MSDEQDPMAPTAETAYTKLTTKLKRGNGTRDQDTTKVVTRHPSAFKAVGAHMDALGAFEELTNRARDIQPEEDDDR